VDIFDDFIFSEKNFKTWDEAKSFISNLCYDKPDNWLFRGMPNSKWNLKTSFDRIDFPNLDYTVQEDLITIFKKRAYHYLRENEIPADNELIDWLTIMQHYGAPTRLLDWTTSLYISAFFSFENIQKGVEKVSIWCLNNSWLHDQNEIILEQRHPNFDKNRILSEAMPNSLEGLVIQVSPKKDNERIICQQGCFLIGLNIHVNFENNFCLYNKTELKDNLYKINIPIGYRKAALYDLELMNINYSTLFPGLEGFARSLNDYYISSNLQILKYDMP
jgi:hypothetical protein